MMIIESKKVCDGASSTCIEQMALKVSKAIVADVVMLRQCD